MWLPVGVNSRNLAAMVVNPDDLVQGRGNTGADSPLAINAVTRLMDGKLKPLSGSGSMSTAAPPPAAGGS
jgi:type IV pilus biogenesis protein CpaD/CtpE